MLLLELYEASGKKTKRHLGTLALVESRVDSATSTVAYTIVAEGGQPVSSIQIQADAQLPWKAALVALQRLYGNVEPYFATLRADGRCNAITSKGKRCRIPAMERGYYCMTHDMARRVGS